MREETVVALKSWRASKKLAIDEEKFVRILEDIRANTNSDLWSAVAPRNPVAKKSASDPLAADVRVTLAKYKATAALKAEKLVRYMLPDRATMPKSMPAALKLLRTYHTEAEIADGAKALMKQLEKESGTDVPL